jgi:hypothetical protein
MVKVITISCVAMMCLALNLPAQDPAITSRRAQIQQERLAKSAALAPDKPEKDEKFVIKAQKTVMRIFKSSPVRLTSGGLPGGSGLAFGPKLEWRSPADTAVLNLSAVGSLRGAYGGKAGLETSLPGRSVSMAIDGAYFNSPVFKYYGPGPNSAKDNRTEYREENTSIDFLIRWRPQRHFTTGTELGPLFVNVGPGTSSSDPSTESVFGPSEAPGIDAQTNFMVSGGFVDFDYRDIPLNPSEGTRAAVAYRHYGDIKLERFSFNRLSAEAEHFIPFLNKKRVIALRGETELSFPESGQVVPFYLQPTLGGPRDLRGFPRRRFYDNNAILFNAEYRWEVRTGLVMALFGDTGQVFDKRSQIKWSNLESDVGFGVRFGTRDRVALRIDTGFSREGFQVWLQLTSPF